MITLKDYQERVLNSLREYFRMTAQTGNPDTAFRGVTRRVYGEAMPYFPVSVTGLESRMPYVCLRVPTGGGKTVIGARCVPVVRDELLETDHPLVLWLVPSEAIRAQTLRQMRNRKNPLRQVLDEELGRVEVMDLSEAMYAPRAVLDGSPVILVSTIQSFRTANT